MGLSVRYTMLMSSLPYLPSLFAVKETPLSRLQLNQRLDMLEPQDAAILRRIQAVMRWNALSPEKTDQQLVARFERLIAQLDGRRALQEVIRPRFELLTLLAALRRRHRGKSAPARGVPWGYKRWILHIERHWAEPGFRLERSFPWLLEATRHLEDRDPVSLERLLMTTAWQHLDRAGEGHYFNFEAAVIYALRFDLIEYWCGWDERVSKARFQKLLEAGLGGSRELFA
jgi:hypothetical protein